MDPVCTLVLSSIKRTLRRGPIFWSGRLLPPPEIRNSLTGFPAAPPSSVRQLIWPPRGHGPTTDNPTFEPRLAFSPIDIFPQSIITTLQVRRGLKIMAFIDKTNAFFRFL